MSHRSPNTAIGLDVGALRAPTLVSLCWAGVIISWLCVAILGAPKSDLPQPEFFIPAMVMLITSGLCLIAGKAPLEWRSSLFLLGMSCTFILSFLYAPSPMWLYYQSLVVSIAGLLAGPTASFAMTTLLTIASVLLLRYGAVRYSVTAAWGSLGLLWATAISSWLSSRKLYTALWWALDSHLRTQEALSEVRQRRADLRRALDSLTLTHTILERTTRELRAARQEAEEARQVKSRFVANISHELRTPLNVIVGFAEMLCSSPETYGDVSWTPALREDLWTIWRNGEHLLTMIDDVLDLAQIEASRLPIISEPTDLAQLIRGTLVTASALLRDSGLELRVSALPENIILDLDPTRIRQVLLNLINNAVRFTPRGYVEVEAHSSGQEIVVCVRDSGVGIPEDKLHAIFEEFEQVDISIRRPDQGAGLGLAISRHLVHLHGGRIWAESEVNKGSTFYFSLPIPEGGEAVRSTQLRRTRPQPSQRNEKQGTMVVLCRDPLVVRMLERHMENLHIIPADSLSATISLIHEEHPEAVLIATDSSEHLPTAVEEAQCLLDAAAPFDLPTVVCTFPTERRAGATLGADDFLVKPVTRKDVISVIQRLCERPRRVLIVDDEPDMLRLLARMVGHEWEEVEVLTAISGREAISLLPHRPDVILLDLLMPEMSGLQVLEALKLDEDAANIPVAIITARGPAEDLAAIRKGKLYVLKNSSFSASELVHCLDSITKSLPPHYVTDVTAPRGSREVVPA